MKFKKRRGTEAPPKVRTFINNVISVPFENIELPLKTFIWEYEKGDFNHWIELFNHFDSFFDKYVKPRKDLQLDDDFQEADTPFPRLAVLQILRVSRTILENCTNKHFYCSYEQHLSSLLASSDADVVIASLQTLAAFVKKPVGKCPIRDTALNAKLFALSQGWGGKEEGLGLLACSTENGLDDDGHQLGSALHFEFYVDESVKNGDSGDEELRSSGLQVIHIPNMSTHPESDIQLLKHLIDEYKVPTGLRFSLLTRLRFARSFSRLDSRRQYICIRLLAFTVLVQASNDANDLAAFFTNEPEFVNELVSLVRFDDVVPEDIRILAILALGALYQDRSRQTTVLNVITSGGHRGILPSLMQKAISSISSGSADCSISFLEALLSLITVLVSSSSGCTALRDVGLMPTLLPLLKNLNTQHIHLVTAAVHVLESFMDYSNPAAISFRDLGGLDNTIARLKLEVCRVEEGTWKETAELQLHGKGKAPLSDTSVSEVAQTAHSETLVPYHRRLLMKALLRAISLGTYAPGNTARLYGSEESALPFCLCTIFRRAKDFGGGVFSLAATVMSDLIHKDPTCYSVLDSAGLPEAFLDAIMAGVLPSAEAVSCIPQCLDALCLNNLGLQAISERGALKCFVKIFTSKIYLRALANDTPGSLSTALDELMRHAASLRGPGVDVLIEILNTIAKIGSGQETPSLLQDSASTSAPVPMETDLEERVVISVDGEESSSATPEQAVDISADSLNSNMEAFLPDCISNATRLLENILHNTDTCGVFIEKKGIEAVLQLFDLPLLPLSFASGQNIAVAFKNFSPQHSSPLTRAVCTALREHLKPALELADSLAGTKLADVEGSERMRILRCLSSLEGVLSFSTHLLKSTTTMMPELGSGDADILKDVGKVYKEVLWQISLVNDAKKEAEQAPTAVNASGSEVANDASTVSVVRYVNPVSMRNGPSSGWGIDPEFLSVIQTGEGLHRHSRRDHGVDGLSRMRLGRLGRQADASDIDIGGSVNAAETSQSQESKRKSPDFLDFETMNKVATAMRSFYVNLVKVLVVPNRRRDDTGSLSGAAKSVVVSLAKLFNDSLDAEKNCTFSEFELSLSTKCRYLGKVVDDMTAVIYDNRRRMCNTAVVNYFYSHGTIQKLLTTFEATGQLLWSVPIMSQPGMETENEKENGNDKIEHAPWLLETLRSYCKLLEHLVNSSLLLTTNSASQLLVQPVVGASLHVPRDPEVFVRTIQAQVLSAVLPIWNHPMFCHCNPSLITSVVSIITHVYSGTGDAKGNRNGIPGGSAQRFRGHPPDETSISMIVDMGFPRSRAEEALRRVETNSVELAMEWLFNHPEEPAQEDDELAQALALSLGKSSEAPKDESSEKGKEVLNEEKLPENPPVEDILATCMNMLQSTDAIAFPMTDLIVTLCCQNKGQYRLRVVPYLVQHLKLWKVDGSEKDNSPVSTISHLLALVLSEDSSAREVAAENGLVSTALELLTNFAPKNVVGEKISVPKWVTALLLVLDHMLQCKLQLASDPQNTTGTGSHANTPEDNSAGMSTANNSNKSPLEENNKETSPFMEILGKSSGYMTTDEQHKAMNIACDYLQLHLPATTVQSVLQLCARLTKSHSMAIKFLERGGLSSLLSLPRSCFFPGFDSVAAAIIRHLLEDPQTLQIAMEVEIRQTLINILNRHGGRVSPRTFLTSMAPVISREPTIFMQAAAVVCQLETVGGRPNIILSKEREDKEKGKEKEKVKEKDKEKDKERDKAKTCNTKACVPSGDVGRVHDGLGRPHDGLGKTPKGHKKIPHSFTQVIDQLLEVILHYPPPSQGEECIGSTMAMEVDEVAPKEKGKAKIEDTMNSESDNVPDGSAGLAKVAFILKLMSDILLMYIHAAGVVLRRDSESSQGRGPCQGAEVSGHGGLLYHVLHRLLPYPVDKTSESNSEEWREKLSEKASWFLVVICGRSSEGRKRVILEIVRALNMASNSVKGSSKHVQLPNKKVLAFVELVNSILSNNASSGNTQVPCRKSVPTRFYSDCQAKRARMFLAGHATILPKFQVMQSSLVQSAPLLCQLFRAHRVEYRFRIFILKVKACGVEQRKRVVVVRHGQSTWNEEGRIQGSSDFSILTQKGEMQAETSRQMLLRDNFDVCFHSPLARSKRTAEIICDSREMEMIPEYDLREIDLYSFQGLLKHEGKKRYGEAYSQWQKDAVNFVIDGHYPVRELWERAKTCWTKILSHKGQSILVVAHNAVNQALVATAIGLGPEYFRILLQSNCGISVLDIIPSIIGNRSTYICLDRLNQTPNSPITPGQSVGRKTGDRIILVCHGTTGNIAEGRLPTSFDVPMNMLGTIQSQKTAELLLDLRVSSILCSPHISALKTAEAIAQVQEAADCLGVDCVPRYVEIKQMQELGDISWEVLLDQLQKQVGQFGRWQDCFQQNCNNLEDTCSNFWHRTGEAWNGLTEHLGNLQKDASSPERNVIVVGHEIVNIGILCHCLGLEKSSIASFHLDTGSISIIDFPDGPNGRGIVRCLNYTAHLGRWSVPVTRLAMTDEDF